MTLPAYLQDVLAQPAALVDAVNGIDPASFQPLRERLQAGAVRRILITGMGGSWTGGYPLYLRLAALGIPVQWIETAELLHYLPEQLGDEHTVVWVISQSGRSVEVRNLVEAAQARGVFLVGCTNEVDSPLAQASDLMVPISSGAEYTVSSKSYMNTQAAHQIAGAALLGEPVAPVQQALRQAAEQMAGYLEHWREHVEQLKQTIGVPQKLVLLGRGVSMVTVMSGSLVLKEAAKYLAEGLTAAHFRHGPLEMADPTLTALFFGGEEKTRAINLTLARDIVRHGGRVFWVGEGGEELPTVDAPEMSGVKRPVLEFLPVQMLSIALAEQTGFVPGEFRHLGKVVLAE